VIELPEPLGNPKTHVPDADVKSCLMVENRKDTFH